MQYHLCIHTCIHKYSWAHTAGVAVAMEGAGVHQPGAALWLEPSPKPAAPVSSQGPATCWVPAVPEHLRPQFPMHTATVSWDIITSMSGAGHPAPRQLVHTTDGHPAEDSILSAPRAISPSAGRSWDAVSHWPQEEEPSVPKRADLRRRAISAQIGLSSDRAASSSYHKFPDLRNRERRKSEIPVEGI